jgi:hypothetical protein
MNERERGVSRSGIIRGSKIVKIQNNQSIKHS